VVLVCVLSECILASIDLSVHALVHPSPIPFRCLPVRCACWCASPVMALIDRLSVSNAGWFDCVYIYLFIYLSALFTIVNALSL
jgi:hypothetical protein